MLLLGQPHQLHIASDHTQIGLDPDTSVKLLDLSPHWNEKNSQTGENTG